MADDNPQAALLQQMLSGTGEPPSMQTILAQLAESNPSLAPYATLFAQRNAQRRELEAIEAELAEEPVPDHHRSLQELKASVRKLHRELEELRGRNDALAAAVGACYLCWGDDLQCPHCRGRGTSGWQAPDAELFQEWIAPAVRRLSLRRKDPPDSRSQGGSTRAEES